MAFSIDGCQFKSAVQKELLGSAYFPFQYLTDFTQTTVSFKQGFSEHSLGFSNLLSPFHTNKMLEVRTTRSLSSGIHIKALLTNGCVKAPNEGEPAISVSLWLPKIEMFLMFWDLPLTSLFHVWNERDQLLNLR